MRVSRIRDFLQSLGSLTASSTFVFVEWHCAIYNIAAITPISRAGHEVWGIEVWGTRHEGKKCLMPHASCLVRLPRQRRDLFVRILFRAKQLPIAKVHTRHAPLGRPVVPRFDGGVA